MMNSKIANNEEISIKELLMISLLCFMDSKMDIDRAILNSAVTLTDIPCLEKDIWQFVKGVVLMLCDKFVADESLNTTISNLVGGNMKIVEDYAQRKVDEERESLKKEFVINLSGAGFKLEDIAKYANVSLEFVNRTLSK